MKILKQNKNVIIKPTEKNLGPAVIDTADYVSQKLKEHLLSNNYRQLTPVEMQNAMADLKTSLTSIIQSNSEKSSQPELTFFKRSLTSHFRLPIFYGLPKVHKNPIS
jgi:molecular chaperone DnaK (HSP70)